MADAEGGAERAESLSGAEDVARPRLTAVQGGRKPARPPRHRHEWQQAVLTAEVPALARLTALAVGHHMTWGRGGREGRDGRPGVALLCRYLGRSDRTVRRALEEAELAGLLIEQAAHAPGRPTTYCAGVPLLRAVDNVGEHRSPATGEEDRHRSELAGVGGEHRSLVTPTPVAGDRLPLVDPRDPPTRTPAREDTGHGGTWIQGEPGAAPADVPPAVASAVEALVRGLPADRRPQLTDKWRGKLGAEVTWLLAAGWRGEELVAAVHEGSWQRVASVGAVLRSRLRDLRERPSPAQERQDAAARAPARPTAEPEPRPPDAWDELDNEERDRWREKAAAAESGQTYARPGSYAWTQVMESVARRLFLDSRTPPAEEGPS